MLRNSVVLCLVTGCLSFQSITRNDSPAGWEKISTAGPDSSFHFHLPLSHPQKGLDEVEQLTLNAANPNSIDYGRWASPNKVRELLAPTTETTQAVHAWLTGCGVLSTEMDTSSGDSWDIHARVAHVECLFSTKIFKFRSGHSEINAAWGNMSLPLAVHNHCAIPSRDLKFSFTRTSPTQTSPPTKRSNQTQYWKERQRNRLSTDTCISV
jgi:tripeptidyl-peptidase-1